MKTILITGASGFIGHFLIQEFIKDYKVIGLVRPGTKNLSRLIPFRQDIRIVEHDIRNNCDSLINTLQDVDIILHAGGNPSSEESVANPQSVIFDNVIGTTHILELARKIKVERFFFYSAGEVFGPITPGTDSHQDDPYNSVSPYAASKASCEEICISYGNTYNIPISITHITNTFGQRLQTNRFPVIAIRTVLNKDSLIIHTGPNGEISGRRWLHAHDVALHTRFIMNNQKTVIEKWNSCGPKFINNLEFASMIATALGYELKYKLLPSERIGNAPYYSLSPAKIYDAGWTPPINIIDRLQETVNWYKSNLHWLT